MKAAQIRERLKTETDKLHRQLEALRPWCQLVSPEIMFDDYGHSIAISYHVFLQHVELLAEKEAQWHCQWMTLQIDGLLEMLRRDMDENPHQSHGELLNQLHNQSHLNKAHAPQNLFEALGWQYVLMGSRLGHVMIARSLKNRGLTWEPHFYMLGSHNAYADFSSLMATIADYIEDEHQLQQVTCGAKKAFENQMASSQFVDQWSTRENPVEPQSEVLH